MKTPVWRLSFTLLLIALSSSTNLLAQTSARTAIARAAVSGGKTIEIGPPPKSISGPLAKQTIAALDELIDEFGQGSWSTEKDSALKVVVNTGDSRLAWVLTDLMRFVSSPLINNKLAEALNALLGTSLRGSGTWNASVTRLIAWDIPAPPDYLSYKRAIFTDYFPQWKPLFVAGNIDWRHVSWGGVQMDSRALEKTDKPCNCIPAADNPEVSAASKADWLDDDAVIFGVSINGEHRAYPRRIMEVREMVNDTLGGRDLGIPYCTLCGSAQAWFTDELPEGVERLVLRTSGLLIRSNKVMYDLVTQSVLDTFLGTAVTGPLAERGLQLRQASVVTTTWGAWKADYPNTTVLVERLALGRDFDFRHGRDANGPIFPIGDVDPRLGIQEDVLGVLTKEGTPIAFHVPSLIRALDAGEIVSVDGVRVILSGGGVRAVDSEGGDLGTHQAFWFAWSQFHKGTALWPAPALEGEVDPAIARLEELKESIRADYPNVVHQSIKTYRSSADDPLLIDVRSSKEFAISRLPGAQNIEDRQDLLETAKANPSRTMVLYCSVGVRSSIAAQWLQVQGIENVVNLEGSIFEWHNRGLPLVNELGSTDDVHGFNLYWKSRYLSQQRPAVVTEN